MKNINKKLLTDSMLEKLEVEENKSRMNFFEIDHIKSEDKKLLKLVSEQHKLIKLLSDYYKRTTICGVQDFYKSGKESGVRLTGKVNLEEEMFPMNDHHGERIHCDSCNSHHEPILSFIHDYDFISDVYNNLEVESIDLQLECERFISPIKLKRQDPYSFTFERSDSSPFIESEPPKYYKLPRKKTISP